MDETTNTGLITVAQLNAESNLTNFSYLFFLECDKNCYQVKMYDLCITMSSIWLSFSNFVIMFNIQWEDESSLFRY